MSRKTKSDTTLLGMSRDVDKLGVEIPELMGGQAGRRSAGQRELAL